MSEPVAIGTVVEPWGRVVAVGHLGGERQYFMVDGNGSVSLVPASIAEEAA